MFQVGDMVCYPLHGVGTIEAIEEQVVLGEKAEYYFLRFLAGRMTAMVPVRTAQMVGLRSLADEDTCRDVLEFLESDECSAESENWNQRYRDNMDKLRTGNIFTVADVVKCLSRREKRRGLSAGERKMYLAARQVLLAEIAAATGESEESLERYVS